MSELKLRPYQLETLEKLRKGFMEGKRTQVLVSPTGSGKTEMAIHLLNATKLKGNKSAMLLDRIVLCDQTSQRMERYKIEHGVMQSGHWRYRPFEHIQVCSAQTLEKRGSFPGLNLLIVDECFTGSTLVSTPTGQKMISLLRCGDTVYNSTGVGEVVRVMVKPTQELYRMEFEDGTSIECTGNHPIFTERGWVKASELEVGRVSFSKKGMRVLWEAIRSQGSDREWENGDAHEQGKMGEAYRLLNILLKEVGQSDERSSGSVEDESSPKGNKAQANQEGWEWSIVAAASTCFASCTGGGLGVGIFSGYKDAAFQHWLSNALQDRHSESAEDDCNRTRRWISRFTSAQIARLEKDRISCFPRVVGISRVKCDSVEPVFNLHISGHPSYFANGKLVHNCHQTRAQTVEFIKNNPEIKVIGLTATPFTKGLGNVYEGVVSSITTKELVDQKMLVPLRVFIAKEIDMSGAKKVAGEWSQAETSKRGMQITGDVVAEWVKMTHEVFGRPRKTIVFCSGVDHGADLARKFAEAGFNFISLSYRDDDDFKKEIIEEFSKPDTEIHGLIATDILTKGFDVPDVMIGVSARPFSKSLSSHIQQMGRVMRSNQDDPDGKQFALWLDHCIASGQRVLTHRGLVPIEEILISDKIWDGHDFVSHKGVVSRGKRPVITYCGLTATPDHLVYTTDEGWCSFGYCAEKQKAIVTTGIGGQKIWQRDGYFTRRGVVGSSSAQVYARSLRVRDLWLSFNNFFDKFGGWAHERLQAMQSAKASAGMAQCKDGSHEISLQQQEQSTVRKLWWKGNPVQIRFSDFLRSLDSTELGMLAGAQGHGIGSHKQRWALRAGQHSLGKEGGQHQQSANIKVDSFDAQIQTGASRNSVCGRIFASLAQCWINFRSNCGKVLQTFAKTERQVWDILDCGPRNSFTCEGLLVHNSGNYLRFREEWEEIYEHGVTELDDGKEKPKKEPTEKEKKEAKCPVCEAYMPRYMDTCTHCGYVREKKSLVQDVPGEMTELQTMSRENKQAWWSQIQWYVENTGKSPGWAAHTFKEKFGVWPRNLSDRSEIPSDDVAKFIEKKKRAFIRKMKRGG